MEASARKNKVASIVKSQSMRSMDKRQTRGRGDLKTQRTSSMGDVTCYARLGKLSILVR